MNPKPKPKPHEDRTRETSRDYLLGRLDGVVSKYGSLEIPLAYLRLTGGNHRAALLLAACVRCAAESDDPEGWFTLSHKEWEEALFLKEDAVRTARRVLAPWLQVQRRRLASGAVPAYYRVDIRALLAALRETADGRRAALPARADETESTQATQEA